MNVIVSKIPIISKGLHLYTGCTSVDKKLYLTHNSLNEIHIFDNNYCYESQEKTNKKYCNIAYNSNDDTFYLLENERSLFKTDKLFSNLERVNVELIENCQEKINSISYDHNTNSLYIVFKDKIVAIRMNKEKEIILTEEITKVEDNKKQFTAIYNYNGIIYIAYTKENNAFIAKLSQKFEIEEEYYIDEKCIVNNIFEDNNILKLFITSNINYIYETNLLKNTLDRYSKNGTGDRNFLNSKRKFKFCNNYLYPNKNKTFKTNCCCTPYTCCECCNYCKPCSCKNNLSDIIESIALEEAGIAHILNAEGEKIQKILGECKDICTILKTNENVSKTINNITMLEQILLSKLQIVENIMCNKNCNCLQTKNCCDI